MLYSASQTEPPIPICRRVRRDSRHSTMIFANWMRNPWRRRWAREILWRMHSTSWTRSRTSYPWLLNRDFLCCPWIPALRPMIVVMTPTPLRGLPNIRAYPVGRRVVITVWPPLGIRMRVASRPACPRVSGIASPFQEQEQSHRRALEITRGSATRSDIDRIRLATTKASATGSWHHFPALIQRLRVRSAIFKQQQDIQGIHVQNAHQEPRKKTELVQHSKWPNRNKQTQTKKEKYHTVLGKNHD